jgi:predicted phosphoribosyltransferase
MEALFVDRSEAGSQLADELLRYGGRQDVIVLALPRGGVPVGFALAKRLALAFDVFVVRKLGVPGFEELALGAIASGNVRVLNEEVISNLSNAAEMIESVTARELAELHRREEVYREGRPAPELKGRTAIVVDDGVATGASMRAAVAALRRCESAKIIVAVPVGAPETCEELRQEADEVVCLMAPPEFRAVGQFYDDFSQVSDAEVRELLRRAAV